MKQFFLVLLLFVLASGCSFQLTFSPRTIDGLSGMQENNRDAALPFDSDELEADTSDFNTTDSLPIEHLEPGRETVEHSEKVAIYDDGISANVLQINKLFPSSGCFGKELSFTIYGQHFRKVTKALVQSHPSILLKTQFISPSELKVTGLFAIHSSFKIIVQNPNGTSSNFLYFDTNPNEQPPKILTLNPARGTSRQSIQFSITSTSIPKASQIFFNGKPVKSKVKSTLEISADPYLDLRDIIEGRYDVWIEYDGCVGKSNKLQFEVLPYETSHLPRLDRIIPFSISNSRISTLTLYGGRFEKNMTYHIGRLAFQPIFISSSKLEVKVDLQSNIIQNGDYKTYLMVRGNKSSTFRLSIN